MTLEYFPTTFIMSRNGGIIRTIPRSDLGLNGLIMASIVMNHRSFCWGDKKKNLPITSLEFYPLCYIVFVLKI